MAWRALDLMKRMGPEDVRGSSSLDRNTGDAGTGIHRSRGSDSSIRCGTLFEEERLNTVGLQEQAAFVFGLHAKDLDFAALCDALAVLVPSPGKPDC